MTYELGQRVTLTGTHAKRRHGNGGDFVTRYEPAPPPTRLNRRPYTEGVIVGRRTVAEGTTVYTTDNAEFTPTAHLTVWLVAYALHRAPVYCTEVQLGDWTPAVPTDGPDTLPLFDTEETP